MRVSSIALVVCAACAAEAKPVTPVAVASTSPEATAPAPPAAPPPPAPPPPPATVTDVLSNGRAAFDTCYSRARSEHPTMGRTSVEMAFTIDPDGRPLKVDLRYKHLVDDRLKECLRDAALALHFPASLQGERIGTLVLAPPGP